MGGFAHACLCAGVHPCRCGVSGRSSASVCMYGCKLGDAWGCVGVCACMCMHVRAQCMCVHACVCSVRVCALCVCLCSVRMLCVCVHAYVCCVRVCVCVHMYAVCMLFARVYMLCARVCACSVHVCTYRMRVHMDAGVQGGTGRGDAPTVATAGVIYPYSF